MSKTLTFRYFVPVHVTVDLDNKVITAVRVDDETPLPSDVNLVDGAEADLETAQQIAEDDDTDWPAWEFGCF
jgi:hypothetical protein